MASLAMLLATGILTLLGKFIFNINFSISLPITIGLIGGSALLALLTATLVALGLGSRTPAGGVTLRVTIKQRQRDKRQSTCPQ